MLHCRWSLGEEMYGVWSSGSKTCHTYSTHLLRSRPRPLRPKSIGPWVWSGGPQRAFLYAPFRPTAKFKAACGLCFNQLDGHVELPWLVRKYDVIHKNGSTWHIATPPEQVRATAIDNMHEKFGKDRTCISRDMLADRQTQTDRQTDTIITILRSPVRGRSNNTVLSWKDVDSCYVRCAM